MTSLIKSRNLAILHLCVLLFLPLIISACAKFEPTLGGADQDSCGFVQNSKGQRVSWKENLPLKINVSSNWPPQHLAAVQRAADYWNNSTGRKLIKISTGGVGYSQAQDRRNGLYWMKSWSDKRKGEQARTFVFFSQNKIYDADIVVNAEHNTYFDDDVLTGGLYHLESLLVHEFGHVLGLLHISAQKSVMLPILNPITKRVVLTYPELNSIECEYGE